MGRPGIKIDIPGFGVLDIRHIVTDYTGTLSCNGVLSPGVKEVLPQLAELVEIHVLTSDTFGTVRDQLGGIPHTLHILTGCDHDQQKSVYVQILGAAQVASFGNGNNDRKMLRAVRQSGGLAVAVDNGEGCALDALKEANIFIHGVASALSLLTNPKQCIATLRF